MLPHYKNSRIRKVPEYSSHLSGDSFLWCVRLVLQACMVDAALSITNIKIKVDPKEDV